MNARSACTNMLLGQIQPNGILNPDVLNLIAETPRGLFAPSMYRHFAFADVKLPLSNGQSMLTPTEEAHVLSWLNPQPSAVVLEVGTGSGYLTALLAKKAAHVYSVDIDPQVTQRAAKRLVELGLNNVTLVTGNAIEGWHARESYDIILVNGSLPFVPKVLCEHLALGGRLFVVVGDAPAMHALCVQRNSQTTWHTDLAFTTNQPRIANPIPPQPFDF